MKYCPTCETRYDEEILRFCMKDGTPLLDEDEPKFVTMPSESFDEDPEDDSEDVTVVTRNVPVPPEEEARPRIVVPTYEEQRREDARARVAPPYQPNAKPNTAKVVFLTILGTVAVISALAAGVYFFQRDDSANANTNANTNLNVNVNANTNLGIDANFFNINANFNGNANTNVNADVKTPTPTPRPSPTASPSPTPDEDATPTPSRTPIPTPEP